MLVAVAFAMVAVSVPLAGPVWTWVTTERVKAIGTFNGERTRTYYTYNRWTGRQIDNREGRTFYYARNGFKQK